MLQTGGKATSKLRNLFKLTGSVLGSTAQPNNSWWRYGDEGLTPYEFGQWSYSGWPYDIPQQSITIGSYGNVNASGVLYKSLPDNANIDVTPYVAGANYYTFSSHAQKYHSYFDVYVQQANPGYSLKLYNRTNELGHAFWRFRTDVPNDAMQYISTDLTQFLGTNWGFYPDCPGVPWSCPGQLENDSGTPYNISRTFYVGFPDMLKGLRYAWGLSTAPPTYTLLNFSCVGAVRGTGFTADVFGLPWDTSAQNFGVSLIQMYPGPGLISGPFIDTSDIFYSSTPY